MKPSAKGRATRPFSRPDDAPHWPELPPSVRRWLALAVFASGLIAAAWHTPAPPPPAFVAATKLTPALEDLPHVARLSPERVSPTRLADGRLALAWLDNAEADNATIHLAIRDSKGWQEIGRIASRESTAAATFMHASRLGRPLLWAEGGWLHLWYEAQVPGSGSVAIIHSRSTDGGRNWSQTHRLESDPLGGLSGARLGQTLLPLADGGVLLPLAGDDRDGPWLRLAATVQVVDKLARLPFANSAQATQP